MGFGRRHDRFQCLLHKAEGSRFLDLSSGQYNEMMAAEIKVCWLRIAVMSWMHFIL